MSKLKRARKLIGKVIEISDHDLMRVDLVEVGTSETLSDQKAARLCRGREGVFLYGIQYRGEDEYTPRRYLKVNSRVRYKIVDRSFDEVTLEEANRRKIQKAVGDKSLEWEVTVEGRTFRKYGSVLMILFDGTVNLKDFNAYMRLLKSPTLTGDPTPLQIAQALENAQKGR